MPGGLDEIDNVLPHGRTDPYLPAGLLQMEDLLGGDYCFQLG